MRLVTVVAAAMMAVAGTAFASGLDQGVMDDEALKKALTDKTIHLSTPAGRLPIRFRADGTMSATAGPDLASYVGSELGPRPLVGRLRPAVPALEHLARRQALLLQAAPARQDGVLDAQRRHDRRGHHHALRARPRLIP